jgi:urease accessory protein
MRAAATVHAQASAPTRLVRVEGSPPVVPRITGPGLIHLVGAAAGPLPGDELTIDLRVDAGATLIVAATAAMLAMPGPDPSAPASTLRTRATVGPGAALIFLGEPLVAVAGCRHVSTTHIELDPTARLLWREFLVPGRLGQVSGQLRSELRIRRGGDLMLAQDLDLSDELASAVLGGSRCAGSLVLVDPAWSPESRLLPAAGVLMPLAADGAALATSLGDAPAVRADLQSAAVSSPFGPHLDALARGLGASS